jgi:hypothetical protein
MLFNPSVPASMHRMAMNVFMGSLNLKGIFTEGIT